MNRMVKGLVGVALVAAGVLGGCGGAGPGRYNVTVAPDPALAADRTPPTIAVDLIAVGGEEAASWSAMPMSRYWAPDSQIRRGKMDSIKTFTFGPGSMGAQTLKRDDPIWDKWKSADTLFVLGRVPGIEDQAGSLDSRRVIFPLKSDRWDEETLRVRVTRTGLVAESQPKPEMKK